MSSFLCFICHSTLNADTNEDMREKYRDVVGMNLCCDSNLCHICCHVLNRLWLFKAVCLKRSLEYPVLFSEKGTLNLQRNDLELHSICLEDVCEAFKSRNLNSKFYRINHVYDNEASNERTTTDDDIVDLYDDQFYITNFNNDYNTDTKNLKEDTYQDYDCNSTYYDKYDSNDDLNVNLEDTVTNITDNYTETIDESKTALENDLEANDNLVIEEVIDSKVIKKKSKSKKNVNRFEKIMLSREEQKAELEANRKDIKYIDAEFKCFNCALSFVFKDTYQAHMMRHEESNGEYRCTICTLRFANPAVLRAHKALHAERHRCVKCGLMLRKRQREDHAAVCHGVETDEASCHLCGRVFKHSRNLQQHIKRFHNTNASGRSYSCNVCGKQFDKQSAVRTHMISHINRKFPCATCRATFSSPHTLRQHAKKHAAPVHETHACAICHTLYSSRKGWLAHQRNVHQQENLPCPKCQRVFRNRRSMSLHIAGHDKEPGRPRKRPSGVTTSLCYRCGTAVKGNKLNRHLREVCQKDKLDEERSTYYTQDIV